MRLRDKRLKHTLLGSRDSFKNRGSWTPGGHRGRGKGGSNQEDNEADVKFEDTVLFEDRCVEQMELGGHFLSDSKTWPEEERGYCFYCGRGQVQMGGQVACTVSKTGKDVQPTDHEDSLKSLRSVETSTCSAAHNTSNIQIVRLGNNVETSDSDVTPSQILLHSPSLQHATPAGLCLPDTHKQKLLLSDACEGESEAVGQEHHLDLQQQQFWIHGTAEGHVILVPVPAEDGLQSFVKMEEDTVKVQTILVPQMDLKGELEHMPENSGGLTRAEAACDEEHCDITSTSAERREDVRAKLKEHLEGFHLQLSTEFLN